MNRQINHFTIEVADDDSARLITVEIETEPDLNPGVVRDLALSMACSQVTGRARVMSMSRKRRRVESGLIPFRGEPAYPRRAITESDEYF